MNDSPQKLPSIGWRTPVLWIALLVLIGFSVLLTYMARNVDLADTEWSRLLYLYGSVEAIVFAATGAIFGTVVQRQQTEAERDRADSAEGAAAIASTEAAKESTKRLALKAQLRSEARVRGIDVGDAESLSTESIGGLGGGDQPDDSLVRLLAFADELDAAE